MTGGLSGRKKESTPIGRGLDLPLDGIKGRADWL